MAWVIANTVSAIGRTDRIAEATAGNGYDNSDDLATIAHASFG